MSQPISLTWVDWFKSNGLFQWGRGCGGRWSCNFKFLHLSFIWDCWTLHIQFGFGFFQISLSTNLCCLIFIFNLCLPYFCFVLTIKGFPSSLYFQTCFPLTLQISLGYSSLLPQIHQVYFFISFSKTIFISWLRFTHCRLCYVPMSQVNIHFWFWSVYACLMRG